MAKWNEYLIILHENQEKLINDRLQEIYTDESYVHHHHRLETNNLYHTNEKTYGTEAPQVDIRICFGAAISVCGITERSHLIPESVWSFWSKSKDIHKGE